MDSLTSVIRESQKPEDTMDKVGQVCAQKNPHRRFTMRPAREISMMCPGRVASHRKLVCVGAAEANWGSIGVN